MAQAKHPLKSVFQVSLLLHNLNKEAERRVGVSIVQWTILKHLVEMPATSAQELSDAVKLHPSTLTQSLKRLLRKKLIFVSEDPRDSRKKVIVLTRMGKTILDQAEQQMDQLATELAAVETELYSIEDHLSTLRVQASESNFRS
jgi:DNA-binding MarR family transcriptional regulator